MCDQCQRRLKVLVLALVAMAVSASDYATAVKCAESCSPPIYECHPTSKQPFSCSISAWFIVVLVFIGVSVVIGIPVMCLSMYMCGMFVCVGAFSKPRARRKRPVSRPLQPAPIDVDVLDSRTRSSKVSSLNFHQY